MKKATVDPYELLRRARELIKLNVDNPKHAAWLKDYKELPGAKLTKKAVHVLRDPHRRMRGINQDIVDELLKDGYLRTVRQMRTHGGRRPTHFKQLRISKKGLAALQLRSDVWNLKYLMKSDGDAT